jgi:hypothetical protein
MKRQSKQVSGTPAALQQNEAIAATASPAPVSPPAVRIVKISTCPSLSGKSTLTYHLGCTGKAEIQIRVAANSGGGFFSVEWIALNTIQKVFARIPSERPITSYPLQQLFRGKSVNTPSFLMAVLKHEGLVVPMTDRRRHFKCVDPAAFIAMVKGLAASAIDLKVEDTKVETKKVAGKVEVKKVEANAAANPPVIADKPKVFAPTKKVTVRKSAEAKPERMPERMPEAMQEAMQKATPLESEAIQV